jgi:hypothetical protein
MKQICRYGLINKPIQRLLYNACHSGLLAPLGFAPLAFEQRRNIVFKIYNRRPPRITGYFVTFPEIPDETVENNKVLANIARNGDWPPLASGSRNAEILL